MSAQPRGAAQTGQVRGLLAPTGYGDDLLLPTTAVAEVVAYGGEARTRKAGPAWLVGDLDWRGQRVPLIDLGTAPEDEAIPRSDTDIRRRRPCVLICFTPSGNKALSYIGFLLAGLPRLVRFGAEDLVPAKHSMKRPFFLCALELQGRPAWVPDLDEAERQGLLLGLLGA